LTLLTKQHVLIKSEPLKLILKAKVRHAAATRSEGESIWVQAQRQDQTGYGEGCPRAYVAGDDLDSSLAWVRENFSSAPVNFSSLDDLKAWVASHEDIIDRFPSAWCAVEMAVLDLMAREEGRTVEDLLGLSENTYHGRYTAVLGDDTARLFAALVDQYLIRGLQDFKIKLSGNPDRDKEKLDLLEALSAEHRAPSPRIRLDANNLWKDRCDEAIAFIRALDTSRIYAVEEPVRARDVEAISRFSAETGLPVILDESLCTMDDLRLFRKIPGQFIANVKVSRAGGLLRTLSMIAEVKKLGWPVIIGCHVGETSLLTRAAMVASAAAGEHLVAHEGAFGDYLLEREPVLPMLKFGHGGLLDLRMPYYRQTAGGLETVPVENWRSGFGIKRRNVGTPDDGAPEIRAFTMSDAYQIHYRQWGPEKGEEALLVLPGCMGHSGWLAPLAMELGSLLPGLTVIASDQRGCGLNKLRGDFGSVNTLIEDVHEQIECLKMSFKRVHLAGWGQGAQCAALAASSANAAVSSLILLAPGFFWNERFRAALRAAEKTVMTMLAAFKLKPERDLACVPLPPDAADFTEADAWMDFIEDDDFKTTSITLKSLKIMEEIQEMSWTAMLRIAVPVLAVVAQKDRIVDNPKVMQFLEPFCSRGTENSLMVLDSGHAIQFDKPQEGALAISKFIRKP